MPAPVLPPNALPAGAQSTWGPFRAGFLRAVEDLSEGLAKAIRADPGRPGAWADALPWQEAEDAVIAGWQRSALPVVRAAIRRSGTLAKARHDLRKDTRRGPSALATTISTEDAAPEEVAPYTQEEIPLATAERMALIWIEDHGLELAEALTEASKATLKEVLAVGVRNGWDVPKMARRVKSSIGLDHRWAGSVIRYAANLEVGGWTGAALDKKVARYRDGLLRARAERIVRTEVVTASNEGVLTTWQALQSAGELPSDAQKVWVAATSDLTCAVCRGLDSLPPRDLGEAYALPRGASAQRPPAHPNCRCALGMA